MSQFPAKPEQSTSAEAALLTALNNLAATPTGFAIVKNSNNTFSNVSLAGVSGITVAQGGTGVSSFTPYSVIVGGTTTTGALQSVASVGNSGQVLTSNGAGALPTWQSVAGSGTVTTVSVVTANGVSGSVANPTTTPAITITLGAITPTSVNGLTITTSTGTLTVTNGKTVKFDNTLEFAGTDSTVMTFPSTSATIARTDAANTFTGHQTIEGVTSTGATGTGNLVFASSPTLTTAVLGSSTATTQSQLDGSTKVATTSYVDTAVSNAVAGVNPSIAVQVATTAAGDTSGLTYTHVAGIGDFFTGALNTAVTIDGHTLVLGDRILIKNDTQTTGGVSAGVFNGVYYVSTIQSVGVGIVLTRALDYDTPSDINNTGTIPVVLGTANANTSWILTSSIAAVGTGTNVLTYVQFSIAPSSIVTLTGTQTLTNKTLTSPNINEAVALTTTATKLNYLTSAGGTTGTTSTNIVFSTSPTLVTPVLGAATATSINGLIITTTTGTLTMTNSKTLSVTNTLTLSGTDSTTMTFPSTTATIARTDAAQTFTGTQTFSQVITTANVVTVTSNAGTVPVTSRTNNFTNSSASAMTITLTTTSAVDGQDCIVRIFDASAATKGITWVNTENSANVTAPATSAGSTTIPLTVGFKFNSGTTKWTCVGFA